MALANPDAQAASIPIIDTHIHLFDPTRPQGVPWPDKNNAVLYKPALPDRYRKIAAPLGVVGAIEVEASPLVEDNQWVLDIAAKDKIIVGVVGDLEPGKPGFSKHFERLHRNKLFLGIRCGNLWGRDLSADLSNPQFITDLKILADAGLEMDTANPTPALIASIVRLTDRIPNLRIVVDHLLQPDPPADPAVRKSYQADLRELGKRPHIYAKVSEVLHRVDGRVPEDLNFYRAGLDELWEYFGQDRLMYGSDWPNSDIWAPYPVALRVAQEYFAAKGPGVAEKIFWKNSIAAYRWVHREANQPKSA